MQATTRIGRWITGTNIGISAFVWMPTWWTIWHTHSAHGLNPMTLVIVEWLQLSNLFVAIHEKSKSLAWYLAVNAVIVAYTLWLAVRYH